MFAIDLDYTSFKEKISSKHLLWQYIETDKKYDIFAIEASVKYNTVLYKNPETITGLNAELEAANILDFETNYKSNANHPLEIKASTESPARIVPSSQPANTTEKWKGYHLELAANETEKTILINFPVDVSLRGGTLYSDDSNCRDYFTVDIVWTSYPEMIIFPNLLECIYMIKNVPIPFISAECMKFPPMLSLQITYHKYDDSLTRCISAIANFYEPNQA